MATVEQQAPPLPVPTVETFDPKQDYMLVLPLEATETPGGIALVEFDNDDAAGGRRIMHGVILKQGPGLIPENAAGGQWDARPFSVEEGDFVWWRNDSGYLAPIEVHLEGDKYWMIRDKHVVATCGKIG